MDENKLESVEQEANVSPVPEITETAEAPTTSDEKTEDVELKKEKKKEKKESNVDVKQTCKQVLEIIGNLFTKNPCLGFIYAQIIIGVLTFVGFTAGLGTGIVGFVCGVVGIYGLQELKSLLIQKDDK